MEKETVVVASKLLPEDTVLEETKLEGNGVS